jgi:hypothetical protein
VKNEGFKGLYKGLTGCWYKECFYSTLRLGTYEPLRNHFSGGLSPRDTSFSVKMLSGGIAGLLGATFSAPADIVKVRMQAWESPQTKGLIWHSQEIHRHWGWQGFLKGVEPTILRAVVLNAVYLSTYDHIKHWLIAVHHVPDGYLNHFGSSMTSGLIITLTTSPFDVVKTRMQNQPTSGGSPLYTGMLDCAWKLLKQEGVLSFYKGFTPQWLRCGPYTVVQLMAWERLRKYYGINSI